MEWMLTAPWKSGPERGLGDGLIFAVLPYNLRLGTFVVGDM
jgi:hypothetical protein